MRKRLLSAFLMFAMVLGMLPAIALPAMAAETPEFVYSVDGRVFTPEDDTTLLLPGSADLKKVNISWEGTDWTVKLGETTVNSGDALDFSSGAVELKVQKGSGAENTVTIRAQKGSEEIPALYVTFDESDGFSYVHKVKGNEADVAVTLLGGDDSLTDAVAEIKGRGNVSWERAKKSYQIKLDKKADVLGMSKSKKWILVPSSYDLSMVRSAVGFELGKMLDIDFSCNYRYVDLYMNGRYYGLYILSEKVEIDDNRIDITNLDDAIEDVAGEDVTLTDANPTYNEDGSVATVGDDTIDLTGGYHLEFDNYDEAEYQFTTQHSCRVTMKEPENLSDGSDVATNEAYKYIKNFVQQAEDAIYQTDADVLRKYFDLESFAKMWLLKEFISDFDATNNMHIWKDSDVTGDGKLHAGPAWDFDNSMDRDQTRASTANNQKITDNSSGSAKWLSRLLRHDAFKEELVRQYNLYKDLFTTVDGTSPLHTLATQWSETFADSSRMDTVRWTGTGNYCKIQNFDDADRAASLKVVQDFILTRNTYMEKRMADFGTTLYSVTFKDEKNGTEQVIPVGSTGLQNLPAPEEVDGFEFVGWYVGENKLEPGEPVTAQQTATARWESIGGVALDVITLNNEKQTATCDGNAKAFDTANDRNVTDGFTVEYTLTGTTNWTQTPPINAGTYDVRITRAGDDTYQMLEKTITGGLVINPAQQTEPTEPTPTEPEPTEPQPTEPQPTEPQPTEPQPTEPQPTEPQPTEPEPTEPQPTEPQPTEPVEHECSIAGFKDVNLNAWYHEALDYMVSNGYMNGKSDTVMDPDGQLTRAELVKILYEIAGAPAVDDLVEPFTDVSEDQWFYNAIVWAFNEEVVTGTSDTTFSPDSKITREQLATILYRYEDEPDVTGNLDAFKDAGRVNDYAVDAMTWAVETGVITGITPDTLAPRPVNESNPEDTVGLATRVQAATMLMRYLEK